MGEPVRIVDLAREMIHLAGADEDDISIVVTGARPGEKVHEELFTDDEQLDATTHRQIMVAHHEPAVDEQARGWVDTLIMAAERRDWRELDRCLKTCFPTSGRPRSPTSCPVRRLQLLEYTRGTSRRTETRCSPTTPQPLDLRRLLSVLRRRRVSIALVTVSITLLAIGLVAWRAPVYTSVAQVEVRPLTIDEQFQAAPDAAVNMDTEATRVTQEPVAKLAAAPLGLDPESPDDLADAAGLSRSPCSRTRRSCRSPAPRTGPPCPAMCQLLSLPPTSKTGWTT